MLSTSILELHKEFLHIWIASSSHIFALSCVEDFRFLLNSPYFVSTFEKYELLDVVYVEIWKLSKGTHALGLTVSEKFCYNLKSIST